MVGTLTDLSASEGARLAANVKDMASETLPLGKVTELKAGVFVVDEPLPHVPLIRLAVNLLRVAQEALHLNRPRNNFKPEIDFALEAPDCVGNRLSGAAAKLPKIFVN